MPKRRLAVQNLVLEALRRDDYESLLPGLEPISLSLGETLYRSGDLIEYVYFPGTALVSLITHMKDGGAIEVGLIGRDGMVGIPVLLGDDIAFEQAVVLIAGDAMRMRSDFLKKELRNGHSPLLTRLLLYTRTLMRQVAQTAACNRRHTTEKRLSRWLLMCHDRVGSDELALTQEFISNMLGTRRAGISSAAISLREEGFISYSRGHVRILKRKGLEEFTCECYGAVGWETDGKHDRV